MSKKLSVPEPLKLPSPELAAAADPAGEFREALDIVEVDGTWQVVVVTYHSDLCVREVIFESQSGPLAAAKYNTLAGRKSFRARAGMPHPEGDTLLAKAQS